MEHFVLVPASVYNKGLITQSVTKQKLPKYQLSQNPTDQIDSLRKEINKILFSKADSLVDKNLSCPRIKLSNSQTFLDGVETGVSLLDFAQQLRRKNAEVPDIYFTLLYFILLYFTLLYFTLLYFTLLYFTLLYFTLLYYTPLVYLRIWFWIRMPKLNREEAGSLSKSERQKLQRLYTQGGAAYGSVRNLVKVSDLSVSTVRQFLHSNPS